MRFLLGVFSAPCIALVFLSLYASAETVQASEVVGCDSLALKAAQIMYGRQYEFLIENTKSMITDYDPVSDEKGLTQTMFSSEELYPVEETKAAKEASVMQFSTFFRVLCIDAQKAKRQANRGGE